ncbi:MAG TPA: plastocyanin/azurin family copper-binding protein [Nitrosopumilaceae archaeon]|nr:plastocyanin/azurin family copper-binding protein [Nitrosopumilaceae archaeon]
MLVTSAYAKGEEVVSATLATQFQLKTQQTAIIESENIQIKFLNVTEDSRCPSDVTCVWEGLVTILVNIKQNGQDLGDFKLTQRGGQEKLASQNFIGQKMDLVEVNPYPKSTEPISFSDYTATLVVSNTDDRTIIIPSDTAKQGCEEKKTCYFPNTMTIPQNTELTWKNMDSEDHTVTSGNMIDGQDNIFSSGLISPGETFSYKFTTMRSYDYYCMLHPWMIGSINVEFVPFDIEKRIIHEEGLSSDGSILVIVEATEPINTEQLGIHLYFKNSTQSLLTDVNYDLDVIQNNKTIFSLAKQSTHAGIAEHWTEPLQYDSPVDVKVKILGIGLPDDESNWTGPKGEIIMFSAVPEFSSLTLFIIVAAFAGLFLAKPISKMNL